VLYAAQRYQGRYAGPAGFAMPFPLEIGPIIVESYRDWYYFVLIFVVATIVVMKNLMRTCFGRAWLFVRSAEPAAETLGINVARYKVLAFVLSSFLISLQGALFAYFQGLITYESYTFQLAVQYVAMLIIGGMGSIAGATVGAVLLTSMPFVLEDAFRDLSGSQIGNLQLLVYGLAMIAFLLFAPGGIAEMGSRFKQFVTSWPIGRIDSRGIRSATSSGIVSAARGLEPIGEPA
jgi:branched-chain amino acid transport system permease protein